MEGSKTMKKSTRAYELAEHIRSFAEGDWDWDALAELCELADMTDEWNNADEATFETVAYAAAKKLGVEIYND